MSEGTLLASVKYDFNNETGENFSVSSKANAKLTASICLPLFTNTSITPEDNKRKWLNYYKLFILNRYDFCNFGRKNIIILLWIETESVTKTKPSNKDQNCNRKRLHTKIEKNQLYLGTKMYNTLNIYIWVVYIFDPLV